MDQLELLRDHIGNIKNTLKDFIQFLIHTKISRLTTISIKAMWTYTDICDKLVQILYDPESKYLNTRQEKRHAILNIAYIRRQVKRTLRKNQESSTDIDFTQAHRFLDAIELSIIRTLDISGSLTPKTDFPHKPLLLSVLKRILAMETFVVHNVYFSQVPKQELELKFTRIHGHIHKLNKLLITRKTDT